MAYKLRSMQNPAWEIQIGTSPVRVGRSKENHLKLTDPAASRHHAEVSMEGGVPVVVDLNSARGTFVNNMRVQKSPLKAGDVVAFGPEQFQCVVAETVSAPARPAAPAAPPKAKKQSFAWVWALGGVVILAVVGVVILMAGPLALKPVATQTEVPPTKTIAPTYTPQPTFTTAPTYTPQPTYTPVPATPANTPVTYNITSLDDVGKAVFKIEAEGSWTIPGWTIQDGWTGSGFVIDKSGIAITNNHVVTGSSFLRVYFEGDAKPITAEVLGISECSDMAVIKLSAGTDYQYLEWETSKLSAGLGIRALGWPLDAENVKITQGIISQIKERIATDWALVNFGVETDAKIAPGSSGGPLVSVSNAKVVGINYAGNDWYDVNLAITAEEVLPLIDRIKNGEQYIWSLGINGEAVWPNKYDIPVDFPTTGVHVFAVTSGGPADRANVKAGDLIVLLEGHDLASDWTMKDYCDILRSRGNPGATLTITVYRFNPGNSTWYRLEGQIIMDKDKINLRPLP